MQGSAAVAVLHAGETTLGRGGEREQTTQRGRGRERREEAGGGTRRGRRGGWRPCRSRHVKSQKPSARESELLAETRKKRKASLHNGREAGVPKATLHTDLLL